MIDPSDYPERDDPEISREVYARARESLEEEGLTPEQVDEQLESVARELAQDDWEANQ
jgi:hypothetical protein